MNEAFHSSLAGSQSSPRFHSNVPVENAVPHSSPIFQSHHIPVKNPVQRLETPSDLMLRQSPACQSHHCSRFVWWASQREVSTAHCCLHDCRTWCKYPNHNSPHSNLSCNITFCWCRYTHREVNWSKKFANIFYCNCSMLKYTLLHVNFKHSLLTTVNIGSPPYK